jgi:hypothetical protein
MSRVEDDEAAVVDIGGQGEEANRKCARAALSLAPNAKATEDLSSFGALSQSFYLPCSSQRLIISIVQAFCTIQLPSQI